MKVQYYVVYQRRRYVRQCDCQRQWVAQWSLVEAQKMALQGASTVAGTRSQVNERNAHRRLQSTLCPHNMSRHVNQHMHCHLHLTSLAHMLSPYFSQFSAFSSSPQSTIRCFPKMLPSSSTSTGSQTATWRRSLTWTTSRLRLRYSTSVDGDVCLTTGDSSPNPVQCDILPHRHSQLSDPAIRLYSTTSLSLYHLNSDFITKCSNCPLTSLTLELQITWPVILRSHWLIASQLTYTVTMTISM